MDSSAVPGVRQIFRQIRCAWDNRGVFARLLTICTHDKLGRHSLGILRRLVARGHPLSEELGLSVDCDGRPLPWLTYPFLDFLDDWPVSAWTVLEFGSGQSTLYWASRAAHVFSYEHSESWFEKMRHNVPANVDLKLFASLDDLKDLAAMSANPDLIVIDGWERESCARECLEIFGAQPLYVLDNAERYDAISKLFTDSGCVEFRFKGFGPVNNHDWCTSLFATPQNMAKLASVPCNSKGTAPGKP